jgi:pimeloyl-ACP methyl ester carboxylesterase
VLRQVTGELLELAYEEVGRPDGPPVLLLHGFPYDVRSYAPVAELLAPHCRVLTPFLRDFGGTRFRAGPRREAGSRRRSAMTCAP